MDSKILIIFTLFSISFLCFECYEGSSEKVNLTVTFWKGNNCNYNGTTSVCSTEGLTKYITKTLTFGEHDTLCANIPGSNPSVDDPNGLIWPHSGGVPPTGKTWNETIDLFCNKTAGKVSFTIYNGLNCKQEKILSDSVMPLNTPLSFVDSPFGSQYNYTETYDCVVYVSATTIVFDLSILFIIVFFLF